MARLALPKGQGKKVNDMCVRRAWGVSVGVVEPRRMTCRRLKLKSEELSLSTVFLSHKLKKMPLALVAATGGPLACWVMNGTV
ncbi:uncharacterized protein G2W53_024924 [Senna tora]|uniref:Uncharacterized protein n=1 Tax=Senna tora TaxID=362788 RepID=A0A834WJT3_9FABA|nr:uncharacterized protein G2W53_024924 [Senna tora]